jgi:hypothetical protein
VKSTLARLNLGVYDRYRVDGRQMRGYGYINVRDEAQKIIEENEGELE